MLILRRTTATDPDFIDLVRRLDAYLSVMDGDEHTFYDQYNQLDAIQHAVVAYLNHEPVGCGAIKRFSATAMEVKRMYVAPTARRQGVAASVLQALEVWTAELGYTACVLETGLRQTEAVDFYAAQGYRRIPNYGQYAGMANSVCFGKKL